ncbi:MAG: porin [Deltaproteobacteria bacterium]|nr:porin [Deltaproteobacteria bacterium]
MKRVLALSACFCLIFAGSAMAGDVSVTPFAKIFAHYQYNMSGYEDYDARFDTNDHNGFELTRTYLGLKAEFNDDWSANVTIDSKRAAVVTAETTAVSTGVADDPSTEEDESTTEAVTGFTSANTGRYEFFVKYAYATYQPVDYFGTSFGMIVTPYAANIYTYWRYRYVADAAFSLYGMTRSSTADLGVAVHGGFPGGYGGYQLAILNGEGVGAAETNAGKAGGGALWLTPFQTVEALKGFALMGTYHYDKVQPDYVEELRTSWQALAAFRYDVDESMGFSVNGEFGGRTIGFNDDVTDPVDSQTISAWADFWFLARYGLLVRYDAFDPNTENDKDKGIGYQDETTLLLAGAYVHPVKGIKLCLNYRNVGYTEEIVDDKGDSVTKQPDQFVF